MDVRNLSNTELKEQLLKHGVNPGPILPSTRSVYEKKLLQVLEEGQVQENGAGHQEKYSDSEDEGFQLKNQMEERNEVNEDRSDGVVNGMSNYSQEEVPACLAAEFNQNLATLGDDFSVTKMLKQPEDASLDDFSELLSQSALGMRNSNPVPAMLEVRRRPVGDATSATRPAPYHVHMLERWRRNPMMAGRVRVHSATRRKPIKGAAGRPIQFRYDDIVTRAKMQEQTKDIVTEPKAQRLIPVPVKIAIFILVAFIALVILSMENSPENPFKPLTEGDAELQQP